MTKKRIIIRVISILLSVILSFALGASIVSLTVSYNSVGAREQFTPIASAPRAVSVTAIAEGEQPVKVLPFFSKVI